MRALGLRTGEYVNARKLHVTEGVDRESGNGFVIYLNSVEER